MEQPSNYPAGFEHIDVLPEESGEDYADEILESLEEPDRYDEMVDMTLTGDL